MIFEFSTTGCFSLWIERKIGTFWNILGTFWNSYSRISILLAKLLFGLLLTDFLNFFWFHFLIIELSCGGLTIPHIMQVERRNLSHDFPSGRIVFVTEFSTISLCFLTLWILSSFLSSQWFFLLLLELSEISEHSGISFSPNSHILMAKLPQEIALICWLLGFLSCCWIIELFLWLYIPPFKPVKRILGSSLWNYCLVHGIFGTTLRIVDFRISFALILEFWVFLFWFLISWSLWNTLVLYSLNLSWAQIFWNCILWKIISWTEQSECRTNLVLLILDFSFLFFWFSSPSNFCNFFGINWNNAIFSNFILWKDCLIAKIFGLLSHYSVLSQFWGTPCSDFDSNLLVVPFPPWLAEMLPHWKDCYSLLLDLWLQ